MRFITPSFVCAFMLISSPALADERFNLLDKDKDGKVSWEEFSGVNTNMPRAAFDSIDSNKDSFFSDEEWHSFIESHGKSMGSAMGTSGKIPMPPMEAGTQSSTMPARDAIPPVVTSPAAPGKPRLIMPPQGTTAPGGIAAPSVPGAPDTPAAPASSAPAQTNMPLLMPPAVPASPASPTVPASPTSPN